MREFNLLQDGYTEKEEAMTRQSWEIARWQTFVTMQPHVKQHSLKRPTDLIRFPWEKVAEQTAVDLLKDKENKAWDFLKQSNE